MKNSAKIFLALGATALAGAVAGYYLNSDNGRKARKNAVKNIRETAKEANTKMNEMAETAKTAIGTVAVQAKNYMDNMIRVADETLDEVKTRFEKGKEILEVKPKVAEKNGAAKAVEAG